MNKHKIYTECRHCGFREKNDLSNFRQSLVADNGICLTKHCDSCGEKMYLFLGDMFKLTSDFISKSAFTRWENKRRKNRKF